MNRLSSSDRRARFLALRSSGWSIRRIATKYGLCRRYVGEIINGTTGKLSVSGSTYARLKLVARERGVSIAAPAPD